MRKKLHVHIYMYNVDRRTYELITESMPTWRIPDVVDNEPYSVHANTVRMEMFGISEPACCCEPACMRNFYISPALYRDISIFPQYFLGIRVKSHLKYLRNLLVCVNISNS